MSDDRFDWLEFGPMPEPAQPAGALRFEPKVEEIEPIEFTPVELPEVEELPEPLTWHVAEEPNLQPVQIPQPQRTTTQPPVTPGMPPGGYPLPVYAPDWPQAAPLAPGQARRASTQEYASAQHSAPMVRSGGQVGPRRTAFDLPELRFDLPDFGGLLSGLFAFLSFDWLFGGGSSSGGRSRAAVDYVTYAVESRHGAEVHYHLANACKIKVASETYTDAGEMVFSVPVYHYKRTERALDALGVEWRKVEL